MSSKTHLDRLKALTMFYQGAVQRALAAAAEQGTPHSPPKPTHFLQARPIAPGSSYPAKEFCSHCGLCDTYYIAHVKEACAFLGDGECV